MIDIEKERGRDTGRGRSRLHAGGPMGNSISGLQDRALDQRQVLNRSATQGSPILFISFLRQVNFNLPYFQVMILLPGCSNLYSTPLLNFITIIILLGSGIYV